MPVNHLSARPARGVLGCCAAAMLVGALGDTTDAALITADSVFAQTQGSAGDISDRFTWTTGVDQVDLAGGTGQMGHTQFGTGLDISAHGSLPEGLLADEQLEVTFEIFTDFNFSTMDLTGLGLTGGSLAGRGWLFQGSWDGVGPLTAFETISGSFLTSAPAGDLGAAAFDLSLHFSLTPLAAPLPNIATEFFAQVEIRELTVRVVPAPATAALVPCLGAFTQRRRRATS